MERRFNKVKKEMEISKKGRFGSNFFTIVELEELQEALYKLWKETGDSKLEVLYKDSQLMLDDLMVVYQRIAS